MSLFDGLSRPIIRFETPAGAVDVAMPAPLFGRQQWIGWVPEDASEAWLCLAEGDPRRLRIQSCSVLSIFSLLQYGLRQSCLVTIDATWLWLSGKRALARQRFGVALGSTPLRRYHQWRNANTRRTDVLTVDRPTFDWTTGPHITFVVGLPTVTSVSQLATTLGCLERQVYPNCSVAVVAGAGIAPAAAADSRPVPRVVDPGSDLASVADEHSSQTVIAPLTAGDIVPDYAAATVAEAMVRAPDIDVWYADDDELSASGAFAAPKLKPDWSPIFNRASGYCLGAMYLRSNRLRACGMVQARDLLVPEKMWAAVSGRSVRVSHIRRLLLTRVPSPASVPTTKSTFGSLQHRPCAPDRPPLLSVVVPSKDKVGLLRSCLRSVLQNDAFDIEVLIVDNGSSNPETMDYYNALQAEERIRVVSAPGPFNFSALCNLGANHAKGSTLLFLNNDTWTNARNWLVPLARWTNEPEVGAVGPMLLYPSGRLQHAGIVLGLGDLAGHIDLGASGTSPGYLRQFAFPREVSAVTGACLALARDKFERVNGFDASAFPVEFSDIDLCLRLLAAGWKTICTPESALIHEESATRGMHPASRYSAERERFRRRWGHLLAADPAFHPALSLKTTSTTLG